MDFTINTSKKNNSYCCVMKCNSWRKRSPEITFHRFPPKGQCNVIMKTKSGIISKVDRQEAWIRRLSMGKSITKSMKVCSLHFEPDDFLKTRLNPIKRHLKKTCIPSLNMPFEEKEVHNFDDATIRLSGEIEVNDIKKEMKNLKKELIYEDYEVNTMEMAHALEESEVDDKSNILQQF